MNVWDRLNRKTLDRCLPCLALQHSPARVEPHTSLRLEISVATPTGVREEFICATCGKRMVRFLAHQTKPTPSDVWRSERAVVAAIPTSGDATEDPVAEPSLDPDSEIDASDECASAPVMAPDSAFAFAAPPD
jgi:hypothetical protein